MSVSDISLERGSPDELSRHDLVLVAIPVAFLFALVAGRLLAVPVQGSMTVAAAVGAIAMADALFLNPPSAD